VACKITFSKFNETVPGRYRREEHVGRKKEKKAK